MVDYSKWDKIDETSDDDGEGDDVTSSIPTEQQVSAALSCDGEDFNLIHRACTYTTQPVAASQFEPKAVTMTQKGADGRLKFEHQGKIKDDDKTLTMVIIMMMMVDPLIRGLACLF